ncbi:MAG: PorT family protein [Prevotella sp.]|nr:PorT family protein [Prevotella sp.]
MKKKILYILMFLPLCVQAQIGEHRNDFAVGFNGGYVFNEIDFVPTVSQDYHGGITGGLSLRYVCEKYFNTICSVQAEVNFSQIGWKEDVKNKDNGPVINPVTGQAEEYKRTLNYLQIPFFAHLAWGREQKGFNFFVQAGSQVGFLLSESTKKNFDMEHINLEDRVNKIVAQDTMKVEKRFDYGIALGGGLEFSHKKVGHFQLEARYYYGLGNIYGDSKRDYFSRSNHQSIIVKLTYLFDLVRTKRD